LDAKSAVPTPVTGSLNVARKTSVSALVGLVAGVFKVKDVTLGAVLSTV
jgi:hypothetical protein